MFSRPIFMFGKTTLTVPSHMYCNIFTVYVWNLGIWLAIECIAICLQENDLQHALHIFQSGAVAQPKSLGLFKDFCKEIINTIVLCKLLSKSNLSTDIVKNFPCNHVKVKFMASVTMGGYRRCAYPSLCWLCHCLLTASTSQLPFKRLSQIECTPIGGVLSNAKPAHMKVYNRHMNASFIDTYFIYSDRKKWRGAPISFSFHGNALQKVAYWKALLWIKLV